MHRHQVQIHIIQLRISSMVSIDRLPHLHPIDLLHQQVPHPAHHLLYLVVHNILAIVVQ